MEPLDQLAALVLRESGIVLRESQFEALAAAVARVDPGCRGERFLRRASDPVEGPGLVARLLDELTVKETYFLREAHHFQQIDWQSLFAAARANSRAVRIWSAGCATGEEAYTLALLACEAFGAGDPPVSILATDVSEAALARAREGEFRPRSTRDLETALRRRYFREEVDRLVVGERLRSLVSFERHNLVHDPAPPRGKPHFELIFCRNVLIYFDSETADRVIVGLRGALAPAGTLVLGTADSLCRGAGHLRSLATAVAPLAAPAPPGKHNLKRALRPPEALRPAVDREGIVEAAGAGLSDEVLARTRRLLADDPMNASAHFLQGLAELERGDAQAAVVALRRALYAEPHFGLAAFQLGRAYEALGSPSAARRSYEQALRTCDPSGVLHEPLLAQVDLSDVVAAARTRLDALAAIGVSSASGRDLSVARTR